jgi:hypothetical protein
MEVQRCSQKTRSVCDHQIQLQRQTCLMYSIALAAEWERAERFSEEREEAAWSLKNKTYVYDATGSAHDML